MLSCCFSERRTATAAARNERWRSSGTVPLHLRCEFAKNWDHWASRPRPAIIRAIIEAAAIGPTIILDKSSYQSLSKEDTYELSRYFYVVVPPVLVLEILADLKKPNLDPDIAQASVQQLARKIQPVDGYVNANYRTLCTADLLGGKIKMDRRPIVAGGRRVVAEDGAVGTFLDNQPANEALIRWSCGRFGQAERILASQWRSASEAIDFEAFKRQLRSDIKWVPLNSLSLVRQVVDELMDVPASQIALINGLLAELRAIPEVGEWTHRRWANGGFSVLRAFAMYARHCVRVNVMFQLALVHGLIGTRSTNRIDMEYLYYSPFAHIFCSGDKLHRDLADQVLEADQSFVWHDDLRAALRKVADMRKEAKDAGVENFHLLEPEEGSLIRDLWIKHLGHWPDRSKRSSEAMTEEKERELMARLRPWIDACNKAKRDSPPPPRWPCP